MIRVVGAGAGDVGSSLIEDSAHHGRVLVFEAPRLVASEVSVVKIRSIHYVQVNGTSAVSALVLREVVAPGELLAAVGALERLVMSVERAVVALEVFLAAEAARAKSADEGLGGILCQ